MQYNQTRRCWKCGAAVIVACGGALLQDGSECPHGSWCRAALPPPADYEQRLPSAPAPANGTIIIAVSTSAR